MNGKRLSYLRNKRKMSLKQLGEKVNRSASTISRYENNAVAVWDPDLVKGMAEVLNTSAAYLMGMTDDPNFVFDNLNQELENHTPSTIIISDDEMSPELPFGASIKIRSVASNEKLQLGSFYYISFNGKKCFRMAIEDSMDGLGFLPIDISERRIAYDPNYVTILGKAVSMRVVFEDNIRYQ